MSYTPRSGSYMNTFLESSAENEELNKDFKSNEFVATTGKAFLISLSIASFLSTVTGLLLTVLGGDNIAVGILLLVTGGCGLLVLPTLFSWRCTVNKEFLLEKYYVLCFKCQKKILWRDIKYQKVVYGNNSKIVFYNQNQKRLISFDGTTVGFHHIVKMAKRKGIFHIKKQCKSEF